jgi:signal recognition particle receptor subunit alpha
MLDLFTIFSKGGIVLWCFQGTCDSFTLPVNELIKSVILQVNGLIMYSCPLTPFILSLSLNDIFEFFEILHWKTIIFISYQLYCRNVEEAIHLLMALWL